MTRKEKIELLQGIRSGKIDASVLAPRKFQVYSFPDGRTEFRTNGNLLDPAEGRKLQQLAQDLSKGKPFTFSYGNENDDWNIRTEYPSFNSR